MDRYGFGRPGGCSAIAPCPKTVLRKPRTGASKVALSVPLHIGFGLRGLPLRPQPQFFIALTQKRKLI